MRIKLSRICYKRWSGNSESRRTWWSAFPPFSLDHNSTASNSATRSIANQTANFCNSSFNHLTVSFSLTLKISVLPEKRTKKNENTLLRFSSSLRWSNSFNLFIQLCLDTNNFFSLFFLSSLFPSLRERSVKSVVNPWRVWVKLRKISMKSSAFLHPHSAFCESHGRLLLFSPSRRNV